MWFDNHTHYYVLLAIERFNVLGGKEELFIKKSPPPPYGHDWYN